MILFKFFLPAEWTDIAINLTISQSKAQPFTKVPPINSLLYTKKELKYH